MKESLHTVLVHKQGHGMYDRAVCVAVAQFMSVVVMLLVYCFIF